jgi:hypothetical protein
LSSQASLSGPLPLLVHFLCPTSKLSTF